LLSVARRRGTGIQAAQRRLVKVFSVIGGRGTGKGTGVDGKELWKNRMKKGWKKKFKIQRVWILNTSQVIANDSNSNPCSGGRTLSKWSGRKMFCWVHTKGGRWKIKRRLPITKRDFRETMVGNECYKRGEIRWTAKSFTARRKKKGTFLREKSRGLG